MTDMVAEVAKKRELGRILPGASSNATLQYVISHLSEKKMAKLLKKAPDQRTSEELLRLWNLK